jgi:hypothetical protein
MTIFADFRQFSRSFTPYVLRRRGWMGSLFLVRKPPIPPLNSDTLRTMDQRRTLRVRRRRQQKLFSKQNFREREREDSQAARQRGFEKRKRKLGQQEVSKPIRKKFGCMLPPTLLSGDKSLDLSCSLPRARSNTLCSC